MRLGRLEVVRYRDRPLGWEDSWFQRAGRGLRWTNKRKVVAKPSVQRSSSALVSFFPPASLSPSLSFSLACGDSCPLLTARRSCSICGAYSCLGRKHQVRILPQHLGPYQSPEGVVMGFGREEGQDVPRDAWG